MSYRGADGRIYGRRGGLSSKNFNGWKGWYIKATKKIVPIVPEPPPSFHKSSSEAYAEYQLVEEINERRDYYESRGYNPDDPYVDIDMALDNE